MNSILNRSVKFFFTGFIITILFSVICLAGNTGKISGRVTDKTNGEPLIGANVFIQSLKIGASTDVNGDYFILNVPPGIYTLTVSMIGYEKVNRTNVIIIIDRTTNQNFTLQTVSIEVENVVVTAERPVVDKDLTASEQIVTSEMLETSGLRSVQDVLVTLPGFFSDNSSLAWQRGRTKSYIRGSSNVQAVYLIDNLSVNSGLVSDNDAGFNTSTIEQISVLTGGYNNDYLSTGIDYWTRLSQDVNSQFYQKSTDSLLQAWREQTTPNDTLADYADRPEFEYEGTLYGSLSEKFSFLVSGRYKREVGIFPQAIPYNPESNIQGYINYKFSPELKIRIGGFVGGYEK